MENQNQSANNLVLIRISSVAFQNRGIRVEKKVTKQTLPRHFLMTTHNKQALACLLLPHYIFTRRVR